MAVTPAFAARITRRWKRHAPHWFWGDRLDPRFLVADTVGQLRGRRALDIGCNAGIILAELDPSNIRVGVDRSDEALRVARRLNPSAGLVHADMLRLPFQDAAFDVVLFCAMLEVPPRSFKATALQEAARVLRPGGTLYLTTPNRRYLRYRHLASRVTYEELRELLLPEFTFEIKGFNPFPPFPYFLPNCLLARVPGIWRILVTLMKRGFGKRHSCAFLVEAVKKVHVGKQELLGAAAHPC
jgi:SAM-dependent methyltransferase